MTKSLYEEALVDAKKLREIAEAQAKNAVLETVAPRIKQMIEQQLLGESEEVLNAESDEEDKSEILLEPEDTKNVTESSGQDKESTSQINAEAVNSLLELVSDSPETLKMENAITRLQKDLDSYSASSKIIKTTSGYSKMVDELIERIEDTYLYVRDSLNESVDKKHFQNRLERFYEAAQRLKESTMKRNVLDEAGDLVLKVSGLPDDLDVDSLGIEVSTEDTEGDEMEMDSGEEAPMEAPAEDDMDVSSEAPSDEEEPKMESRLFASLSDDDVIEISESALRNEIARLKGLRVKKEGKMPVDAFGGGHAEGDPFVDGTVTTADGEADSDGPVSESSMMMDEEDDMVDETGLRRKEDDFGSEAANQHSVKAESKVSKSAKPVKKEGKPLQRESADNRRSPRVADKNSEAESLRRKLDETNLFNVKLIASNKLLQNESLSAKQKRSAIERLDEAATIREVKLVYESIVRALSGRRKMDESRVIGSSSKTVSRSGAAPLNESVDNTSDPQVTRWQVLAGLSKK